MKLGFAGSGNMAAAMARGWASSEAGPEAMVFTDAGSGRAAKLAEELGGTAVGSLGELAEASDAILLAVKPAGLEQAATEIGERLPIISVLGATSVEQLRAAFGSAPVLRTMPTVATELRCGVICHAPLGEPEAEVGTRLLALVGELGELVQVDDEQMDAATAVMGCTPAYFAVAAEALAAAGANDGGLDPDLATSLVVETMASTAALLRRFTPQQLRLAVASPGGSTEAGLDALDAGNVGDDFADAVHASLDRMRG
jgi:pyrroline-5-carboxylate reductase